MQEMKLQKGGFQIREIQGFDLDEAGGDHLDVTRSI